LGYDIENYNFKNEVN